MTVPPDDRMTELRQLFFETAAELVQKLNDEAMQLEKSPGDAETARSLRRTVHTLKGDSAACGFRELSELCHEFEDVLTLGNTAAAASVPEIALRAADVFAALLEAYQKGTKLPSIQSLRADIARLAHPAPGGAGKATQRKKKAAAKTIRWSEYEQLAIARAVAMGKRVHHVVVEIDPQCAMPIAGRQMIQLALAGLGEVLALYPAEGSLDPIKEIEAALVSEKPVEQIRAMCSIPTIALNAKVKPLRAPAPLPPLPQAAAAASEGSAAEGTNEAALPAPAAAAAGGTARCRVNNANDVPGAAEAAPAPAVPSGPDNLLRVDAEKIDSVLNLVGELILAKSMLQQALLEFGERFPKDGLRGKFADAMVFQGRAPQRPAERPRHRQIRKGIRRFGQRRPPAARAPHSAHRFACSRAVPGRDDRAHLDGAGPPELRGARLGLRLASADRRSRFRPLRRVRSRHPRWRSWCGRTTSGAKLIEESAQAASPREEPLKPRQ